MGDIPERPAMNKGGSSFERLYEVGLQRILEKDRHRALYLELARPDRLSLTGVAHQGVSEPFF